MVPEPAATPSGPDVRLITVSASYGAGGSVVAPALAGAAVHSYVVTFWVSAAILGGSAVVCALVLPSGTLTPAAGQAAPPVTVTREEMTVRGA